MARYEHLPIYRAAFDLAVHLEKSDGLLDLLGEKFLVPPEAHYEYVRASVNVRRQLLTLYLNGTTIDKIPHRLH